MISVIYKLVFFICIGIVGVVICIMIRSVLNFRRTEGDGADTTKISSTKVEVVWAVIPLAILVFSALPAAETILEMTDTRTPVRAIPLMNDQSAWQCPSWSKADIDPCAFTASNFDMHRGPCNALCGRNQAPRFVVGTPHVMN